MKKVVSVVTAPFRAIGRLLLKLLRSLRVLGKPLAKLAGLRGRARIVALAVLAVVVVVAVITLKPGPDEDKQVRETLDRYAVASRDKDYQTLCDDLLASELVERIRSAGLPCEVALKTGLENRRNPTLKVLAVEVNGDQALARVLGSAVGEPSGTSTYRLVREDGSWHIATPPGSETQSTGAAP
jgi:hypothetical protein